MKRIHLLSLTAVSAVVLGIVGDIIFNPITINADEDNSSAKIVSTELASVDTKMTLSYELNAINSNLKKVAIELNKEEASTSSSMDNMEKDTEEVEEVENVEEVVKETISQPKTSTSTVSTTTNNVENNVETTPSIPVDTGISEVPTQVSNEPETVAPQTVAATPVAPLVGEIPLGQPTEPRMPQFIFGDDGAVIDIIY